MPHRYLIRLPIALVLAIAMAAPAAAQAPAEAPPTAPATAPAEAADPADPGTAPAVDPTQEAVLPGLPEPARPPAVVATAEEIAARTVPGPAQVGPELTATGAVLFDPLDEIMLFEQQARVPRAMASTTKIMTVMLALEAIERGDVPQTVTVSAEAVRVGAQPGRATLGLVAGQEMALEDVLAGLLLRSGNDGAVVVAEAFGNNETAYAGMMTARAQQLGLEDTAFLDASGLSNDPGHHATPLDLARLGVEAMRFPRFAEWAGSSSREVGPLGVLQNRNTLIGSFAGATGIKTGFTSLAGYCLVASAERDGRVLYAVVLGSETDATRFAEAAALLEHGFDDFARPVVLTPEDQAVTYRWAGAQVPLEVAEPLARTVGVGAELSVTTTLAPDVALPVAAGEPLGTVEMQVDGQPVQTLPLLAAESVAAAPDTAGGAIADAVRAFARLAPSAVEVRETVTS